MKPSYFGQLGSIQHRLVFTGLVFILFHSYQFPCTAEFLPRALTEDEVGSQQFITSGYPVVTQNNNNNNVPRDYPYWTSDVDRPNIDSLDPLQDSSSSSYTNGNGNGNANFILIKSPHHHSKLIPIPLPLISKGRKIYLHPVPAGSVETKRQIMYRQCFFNPISCF